MDTTIKGEQIRKTSGKALVIFIVVMAALTFFSNALNEMVMPVVTTTSIQRGSLDYRVNADGVLSAAGMYPIQAPIEARVTEILVKIGQSIQAGDPLLNLDCQEVLSTRHKTLIDALNQVAIDRQNYNWAKADISTDSLDTLEYRRKNLTSAELKLDDAQKALDDLVSEDAKEADIKRQQSRVKTAQENVDYYKRRLEQYTTSREYMRTSRTLTAAEQALDIAWRDYFDTYAMLNGAQRVNQEKLREAAIRHVEYGGSATELIPHNRDIRYPATLYASAGGEVITINAKLGEALSTSTPALTLSDDAKGLSLIVTVDSDDASLIQVGAQSEVVVDEQYEECLIESIAPSADENGKYDVALSIPKGIGSIGLRASMRYHSKSVSYDTLIPLTALREDGAGKFVYMIESRSGSLGDTLIVKRVDVQVLDSDQTRAAVQASLTQRDVLVLRSERPLSDGDRIRLKGAA